MQGMLQRLSLPVLAASGAWQLVAQAIRVVPLSRTRYTIVPCDTPASRGCQDDGMGSVVPGHPAGSVREQAGAFGEQEGRDADPVGAADVDPGQAEQGRRPQDIEKGGIEIRIECQ